MITLFDNNLLLYTSVAIIAGLGGIGLLIFGILRMTRSSEAVRQRMQVFVNDRRESVPFRNLIYRITPRELSGSFFNRAIRPYLQRFINFLGKLAPSNSIAKSNYDLRVAGNPYGMHARDFYAVRLIILAMGIGLGFYLNFRYGFSNYLYIVLGVLAILIGFLLPKMWLGVRIRRRKEEITQNLPDLLDMLSVCATAGLSFDQGLNKICDDWPTALTDEFRQVLKEMEMGVSRSDALRNLKARVEVDPLSGFIAVMIQAESTGMSYAEVLKNQARQLRVFRQIRAKEKANSLPAKMIIPIVVFIFPALLAVIVGPVLPILMNLFQ